MKTTDAMDNLLASIRAEGREPVNFSVREDDWLEVLEHAARHYVDGDPARPLPRSYLGIPVEFIKLHEGELAVIVTSDGGVETAEG